VTSVVRSSAGCPEPEVADRHADLISPFSLHVALRRETTEKTRPVRHVC